MQRRSLPLLHLRTDTSETFHLTPPRICLQPTAPAVPTHSAGAVAASDGGVSSRARWLAETGDVAAGGGIAVTVSSEGAANLRRPVERVSWRRCFCGFDRRSFPVTWRQNINHWSEITWLVSGTAVDQHGTEFPTNQGSDESMIRLVIT